MANCRKRKIAAVAAIHLLLKRRIRRRARWINRKLWCRTWIMRRKRKGVFHNLVRELENEDTGMYKSYMRMLPEHFNVILEMVRPHIQRQDTVMRESISGEQRLALTLRFLATGESLHSLSFAYRVGRSTASGIVKDTCSAICNCMKDTYLKMPDTPEKWKNIAKEFNEKWNYPFCVGALDGKHVRIKNPEGAGSLYFNYKKFYSIVLLALVDANYRFLYVDIGAPGRNGDAGIYSNSTLKVAVERNLLNFPDTDVIPGTDKLCSYHIVGDDAFALNRNMMKPYSHRNLERDIQIFNYRLSRARRVVENAFGILSNRFRILHSPIPLEPEHIEMILLACCCLHNYLKTNQSSHYVNNPVEEGVTKENICSLTGIQPTSHKNAPMDAKAQRHALKDYFISAEGMVPWQENMISFEQ